MNSHSETAAANLPEGRLHTLMARYVANEPGAFEPLYAALAPKVRARLSRLVHDGATVEDLLQLTFMRGHLARDRFESLPQAADRAVEGWYLSIARNVALDHLRESYRRQRRHTTVFARGDGAAIGAPDAIATPEEVELAKEETREAAKRLEGALGRLPATQREVVTLHKLEGLSMAEVADRLHVKQGAVRVRAHRAYKALAAILGVPSGADMMLPMPA
jgi:RNA polymerase sigma-70 factor (ECF subfamily)